MQRPPWNLLSFISIVSLIAAYNSPAVAAPWQQGSDGIPKIIHQSWKTDSLPSNLKRWQSTIRTLHPSWEYRLWTDETNRQLVAEHYPWLLEAYDGFPEPIMRADSARILYMHRFGGLYADLDIDVLRPFDSLLAGQRIVLASMTNDTSFPHSIPNAWMASVPGHHFWQFCLSHILASSAPCTYRTARKWYGRKERTWDWVEQITGPAMLRKALASWNATGQAPITVLRPELIFPIDWRMSSTDWTWDASIRGKPRGELELRPGEQQVCNARKPTFSELHCKAKFPEAYAISYWMHSW